ncbi:MAG: GEVED domain-containing protein, partial [Dermatophilaceae bacterium]
MRERRHVTARRRVLAAIAVVAVCLTGGIMAPAFAYQVNTTAVTGTTGPNGSALITFPGGTTATVQTAGQTTLTIASSTLAGRGATVGMFDPQVSTSTSMPELTTSASGCAASGLCSNRGTVTITFSRPVRNPVLHVAGLGGSIGTAPNNTILHALGTITSSSPAGATFGAPNGSAVNLSRTNGNLTFDTTDPRPSSNCGANTVAGQTSLSGCGSLPVLGTYTSITMRMDILMAPNTAGTGTAGTAASGDAFVLGVTVPEDFGDAPASYDTGTAASHVLSDLQMGPAVDADNVGTANATTSPNAVAAGASASSTNGDGADEDGVTGAPPDLPTSRIGLPYTITVPISGASSAGQLCGFLDFNRSGTFTVPGERACAAIAAGATSVPLTWTVPAGSTSAGTTYLRLRASYTTAQAELPTGRADSGEVEDYSISIFPTVRVTKTVAGGSTRTFDIAVNGTNVGTVGNGGTTSEQKVFHTSAFGAPNVTVAQNIGTTAVPLTITE